MIKAVIFDLFGTLVHLTRNSRPYLQICRQVGEPKRIRDSLIMHAPSLARFCDAVGVEHPHNLAQLQSDLETDIKNAALFSDTTETLQSLRQRGIRMAVISNLASPYKRVIDRLGVNQYFEAVVCSCDVGTAKPNAEIYLVALSQLNLSAVETIMVGDSYKNDVEGPIALGVQGYLLDRNGTSKGASLLKSLVDVHSLIQ